MRLPTQVQTDLFELILVFQREGDTRTHPDFPWRLRLSFATDIARALAYLHARKCIHRDLKGENLLVCIRPILSLGPAPFSPFALSLSRRTRR